MAESLHGSLFFYRLHTAVNTSYGVSRKCGANVSIAVFQVLQVYFFAFGYEGVYHINLSAGSQLPAYAFIELRSVVDGVVEGFHWLSAGGQFVDD